jgi:Protein of unknown function (DUF3558)
MRRLRVDVPAISMAVLAALFVIGCGGQPPISSSRPSTDPPATGTSAPITTTRPAPTAPTADVPTPDELCAAFTDALAVAALGEPVSAASSGEVVPRPNGVYCHYAAAADANHNVEAQVNNLTRQEFGVLASAMGLSDPLPGVGEQAFKLDRALLGGEGAVVLAWAGGRVVNVTINAEGDQAAMNAAATAIATTVLALP